MIDRQHKLPVSHQCALLGLARSTACYTPREVSAEGGHHLHSDAPGFPLPVRGDRRVLAPGPCLAAALQHLDDRFLSRRGARSPPAVWLPGDLQHRSGGPVHQRRVHRSAQGARHPDQHGRQGSWRDNVFVEHLWKTVKYEEGYLKADDRIADAKANLATYLRFDN